jgi:hypothetical protein
VEGRSSVAPGCAGQRGAVVELSRIRTTGRCVGLVLVVVAGLVAPPVARADAPPPTVGAFDGGPLRANPKVHVPRNRDYEPGAAVAPDGSIWVAASVQFITPSDDPREHVVSGEDIWRSTDGGHSFSWIADPADLVGGGTRTALGGGDTDITTATVLNRDGTFNVYAVTAWAGSTTLSISRNSGRAWTTTPVSSAPGDRPWLAADGACVLYLTHKTLSTVGAEVVERFNLCSPSGSLVSSTTASSSSPPHLLSAAGKPAVDHSPTSPHRHSLYIGVLGCGSADGARGCTGGSSSLDVDTSRDGGRTFTRTHVADVPGDNGEGFAQVATDAAGTVYVTWGDYGHIFFGVSRDGGTTWQVRALDMSRYLVAALPQVAADRAGEVVLSWYGSAETASEDIVVFVARSFDAGKTFAVGAASPVIHHGRLCGAFDDCSDPNGNDLRDDFAVVIHPITHKVTVAYTSDRPEGDRSHDFVGYATER